MNDHTTRRVFCPKAMATSVGLVLPALKGSAIVENRFGKGRALSLAPDLMFSIVHVQQGVPVFQDTKPASDGSATTNDGERTRGPSKQGTIGSPLGGAQTYFPLDDEADTPRFINVLEVNMLTQDLVLVCPAEYGKQRVDCLSVPREFGGVYRC